MNMFGLLNEDNNVTEKLENPFRLCQEFHVCETRYTIAPYNKSYFLRV